MSTHEIADMINGLWPEKWTEKDHAAIERAGASLARGVLGEVARQVAAHRERLLIAAGIASESAAYGVFEAMVNTMWEHGTSGLREAIASQAHAKTERVERQRAAGREREVEP